METTVGYNLKMKRKKTTINYKQENHNCTLCQTNMTFYSKASQKNFTQQPQKPLLAGYLTMQTDESEITEKTGSTCSL